MSPKSYRQIVASHSSIASPSCFSRGSLALHKGKSAGGMNQSFTISTSVVVITQAGDYPNDLAVVVFSLKVNFDDVRSILTKHLS